jgi:hypothetical protein
MQRYELNNIITHGALTPVLFNLPPFPKALILKNLGKTFGISWAT